MTTYNRPTGFYSDFTETSGLFSTITSSFPTGNGKFQRRLQFGSATSALGASSDNSADCLIHNDEQECYVDAGAFQCSTGLQIQGVLGGSNPISQPWTSGVVCTSNMSKITYGYAEVMAMMPPSCNGLFPAFWLVGTTSATDGGFQWEIDIAEFAHDATVAHAAAIQWGNEAGYSSSDAPYASVPTASTAWHKYGCRWDSQAIQFFLDDQPYGTSPSLPPMPLCATYPGFLIVNLAIGGPVNYAGQPDSSTPNPLNMYIRSVGLWTLSDWPSSSQTIPLTPPAGPGVPNYGSSGSSGTGSSGSTTASADGTTVTTTSGSITDANGHTFTLVQSQNSGLQIAINGTVDTTTSNVVKMVWQAGTLYQLNVQGNWYTEPAAGGPGVTTNPPTKGQVVLTVTDGTAGSSAITNHMLYMATSSGGESTGTAVTVTNGTITVTNLTDGTPYYFQVSAVNSAGEGPKSTEVSVTPISAHVT